MVGAQEPLSPQPQISWNARHSLEVIAARPTRRKHGVFREAGRTGPMPCDWLAVVAVWLKSVSAFPFPVLRDFQRNRCFLRAILRPPPRLLRDFSILRTPRSGVGSRIRQIAVVAGARFRTRRAQELAAFQIGQPGIGRPSRCQKGAPSRLRTDKRGESGLRQCFAFFPVGRQAHLYEAEHLS